MTIKKAIRKVLNLSLYNTSRFYKRNNKIWVFAVGKNPYESVFDMYNYVTKYHKDIRCVWIYKYEDSANELKKYFSSKHIELYHHMSNNAIVIKGKAKVFLSSYGPEAFGLHYLHGGAIFVRLTHNIVHHKLQHQVTIKKRNNNLLNLFDRISGEQVSLLIANTDEDADIASWMKLFLTKDIKVTGKPKSDRMFRKNSIKDDKVFKILYLPTLIRFSTTISNIIPFTQLNNFLKSNNIQMSVKFHYGVGSHKNNLTNIKFLRTSTDTTTLLKQSHLLITDYSNVVFDYLPLNRPIIRYIPNLSEFLRYRGLIYEGSDMDFCTNIKNVVELKSAILTYKEDPKYLQKERKKALNKFYKFKDIKNSHRVYKEIVKLV